MITDLRQARTEDTDALLGFMREFNASQGYPFEASTTRRAALELIASPTLGRLWMILADDDAVGYLALTFGFSLEYGGRDAFVDELFVVPAARGRGVGRRALELGLDEARRLGVRAVHLEVENDNPKAHDLYRSLGFEGNDRRLLTRRLADPM